MRSSSVAFNYFVYYCLSRSVAGAMAVSRAILVCYLAGFILCCSTPALAGTDLRYTTASAPQTTAPKTAESGGACGPSVNTICGEGQCCSSAGSCGVTPDHCGTGCQADWGKCDSEPTEQLTAQQNTSAESTKTAESGGACGPSINTKCSSGQCCSSAGYCGVTPDHCGTGCQADWGKCDLGSTPSNSSTAAVSPSASPTVAERGGKCGPSINTMCGADQCCSTGGYCGITRDHCVGTGCWEGWGKCGPEYTVEANASAMKPQPDNTTKLASPGGPCGPNNNAMCPGGQCCSTHGFCGVEPGHCDISQGCQLNWGTCNDGNASIPAVIDTKDELSEPRPYTGLSPSVIAGIVSSVIVGVGALVGLAYTGWKWWIKHRAMKKGASILPRVKDVAKGRVARPEGHDNAFSHWLHGTGTATAAAPPPESTVIGTRQRP